MRIRTLAGPLSSLVIGSGAVWSTHTSPRLSLALSFCSCEILALAWGSVAIHIPPPRSDLVYTRAYATTRCGTKSTRSSCRLLRQTRPFIGQCWRQNGVAAPCPLTRIRITFRRISATAYGMCPRLRLRTTHIGGARVPFRESLRESTWSLRAMSLAARPFGLFIRSVLGASIVEFCRCFALVHMQCVRARLGDFGPRGLGD